MEPKTLLDTNVLSALMRRTLLALSRARSYVAHHRLLTIWLVTRFEILRGLAARRGRVWRAASAAVVAVAALLAFSARWAVAGPASRVHEHGGVDGRGARKGQSVRAAQKHLYVATNGDDAWSGTLAEPNPDRTDGPFASLQRARDEIRRLKRDGQVPAGGVAVEIRGGRYYLGRTLELTAADSGARDAPVVYRAHAGEAVRLIGGRRIGRFEPVTDPAVLKRLDPAARGHVLQADLRRAGVTDYGRPSGGGLELFFDDRPMTLARWPNHGFVHIVETVGGQPFTVHGRRGDRVGKFKYQGDRPRRWLHESDLWLHGYWFWDWSDQRHKVASIDVEKRIIAVEPPYHHYGYRQGQWYYAYNALAELDEPGEWYLDRGSGVLYFWPPRPIGQAEAVVSTVGELLRLQQASHVTFAGLTFEVARGTAVVIRGGRSDRLAGCTLRNLGGWAVQIAGGADHGVLSCHIYYTGDGGVSLSGGDRRSLTPAGHFADNNHIHHYARWNLNYRPAISLAGVGNRAAHNLIHHAPHQAMAFGGNDHRIEFNEIHHVCLKSNDAGAIYSGRDWTMRGTVIRYNFMHHISGYQDRGCVGVYLDDMFCGTRVFGNVFYRVTRAAFIGGGRDVAIENNIFVDCSPAVHIDARAMGWAGYHVNTTMKQRLLAMPYRRPPWSQRYPKLVNILEDEPAAPKGNLVARNVCVGGRWDEVQAAARRYVSFHDNLVDADVKFVDRDRMNFQLPSNSPVYERVPGFQPIPFDQIGLVPDRFRPGDSGPRVK